MESKRVKRRYNHMISTKNEKSLGGFEIFRPIIREEKNSKKMLKRENEKRRETKSWKKRSKKMLEKGEEKE
jgi:hypothetical protein